MTTFNNAAVNETFDAIINDTTYTEQLLDQGIGDIFVARVAGNIENTDILGSIEFATKVSLDQSAKNYEAARKAVQRVLDVCFPAMETASKAAAPKESNQADPVAKLLKSFEKLTAAQRKKFLAAV